MAAGCQQEPGCPYQLVPRSGAHTNLRKWFGHKPARWNEFRERYKVELKRNMAPIAALRLLAKQGPLTLVFGARDQIHNEAAVLRNFLLSR